MEDVDMMTLAEFRTKHKMGEVKCRSCSLSDLAEYSPSNGNHVGVICNNCKIKDPIEAGKWWLVQNGSSEHLCRTKSSPKEIMQTWSEYGFHCAFCGMNWELCTKLGISKQRQHVWPLMFGGPNDGKVIPICSRCQEMTRPLLFLVKKVAEQLKIDNNIDW